MKTLEGLPVEWKTLGWEATRWIEYFCVHGPGSVAGQPVRLDDEDVRFLLWAYRLDEDGRRVVDDADLSAPKGWAKSELAGFIVLFEAFGPCRFAYWGADGEPVGRPILSPFIRCLATEEGQAGNTYRNVLYSLQHSTPLASTYRYDAGLTRVFLLGAGGGEIRPSTSGDASKDGGIETFTVADETHLYVLEGLKEMFRTVERNCRKRMLDEPWMLRTTTAYEPGEESIAEDVWGEFEAMECDVERALAGLGRLVDHREADIDADSLADKEALTAALIDVYGGKSAFVDIPKIVKIDFGRPGADIPKARRYFLNQRVKGSGKWIGESRYDKRVVKDRLRRGDRIALGFDGSKSLDSTGFVGCRLSDGLLDPLGYWERPPKLRRHDQWEVPFSGDGGVDETLEWIMETFEVVIALFDPHWWRGEVDTWHGRWPDIVTKFDTSKRTRMVHAVNRMATDIDSGAVRFTNRRSSGGGDGRTLRRHYLNAYAMKTRVELEPGVKGVVIGKENRDSRDLMDLAMGGVLANEGRGMAIADGANKPKKSRKLRTS